jgi:hypothetical protein
VSPENREMVCMQWWTLLLKKVRFISLLVTRP